MNSLQLTCPAKVNLALSIGAADPARANMHPIASWMVALSFGDHLTLTQTESKTSFSIRYADHAPVPAVVDWPLEKDLAVRAHAALCTHVGRSLPVAVAIHKFVPAGAGLGGGSSDAATLLVGMNRLYELGLDAQTLVQISRPLGSDIAFLVHALLGEPSCLVTGLGDQIEPLPLHEILHVVLIFPGFGCATGPVYRAFDAANSGEVSADVQRVRELAQKNPLPQDGPFNDLAEPARQVAPKLRELQHVLEEGLTLPVHITGSGSTMFVIAPSAITAKVLARKATAISGLAAVATRTL